MTMSLAKTERFIHEAEQPDGLVGGSSRSMRHVLDRLRHLARDSAPLLIQGEEGTGKRRLAEALHRLGPNQRRPLFVERCSALSAGQLEARLYGGVTAGGTLVLHRVADLSHSLQSVLSRWLSENRLPSRNPTDPRIVVTSRSGLEQAAADGSLSPELYARLHVIPSLSVPSLRERAEDIPALFHHFLGRDEGRLSLSAQAWTRLTDHSWPGNVEELKQTTLKARLMAAGPIINAEDLSWSPRAVNLE